MRSGIRIGTAGWTIPRAVAERFPGEGGHLQRYASRFDAAEINSSFHRPHRPATYARWAECVPADFRFAVKTAPLGGKLGPLLVQLPPSLAFDAAVAEAFFAAVRARFAGALACEPRHASWFEHEAEAVLVAHEIARVAADPARAAGAGEPGGFPGLVYVRLHGSPRTYFSSYEPAWLADLARKLVRHAETGAPVWCIFDNTAHGAAAPNALAVVEAIDASPPEVSARSG